jgi:hypothetical protein
MKLYRLLFEGVSRDKVILGIKDLIKSSSRTGQYLFSLIGKALNTSDFSLMLSKIGPLAEDFYETNKGEFDKIFRLVGADNFEYLGSGSFGDVFSLGDRILKIELEPEGELSGASSEARAAKAVRALFRIKEPTSLSKESLNEGIEDLGSIVPMIYDQGSFVYPPDSGNRITWVIMERFETLKGADRDNMAWVLPEIIDKIDRGEQVADIKNVKTYDEEIKKSIRSLGRDLRLKSGWFGKLVDSMLKLRDEAMEDFHSGNIGVRRVGPEGELVFFD